MPFVTTCCAPAKILPLFTPGAPRADHFEGLSQPADATGEEQDEFFTEHGSYFVE